MAARNAQGPGGQVGRPIPPRVSTPEVPPVLDEIADLAKHDDVVAARIALGRATDAAHARVAESAVVVDADALDLEGATLTDVRFDEPRLVELRAPRSRWQTVLVEGGRLGTLDLSAAGLDGVELRGIRIDYLSLAQAQVRDLLLVDCVLGTVDLPQAVLRRVRFEGCRADEVDTRDLRATDLDLRGLEALSYTQVTALRGATMTEQQAYGLAPEFAAALGLHLSSL